MLERFMRDADRSDEVVTHNGNKFDIPWVRTRCLLNNVPMRPDFIPIDTCQIARTQFNFNSNSLAYIAKELGLGGKMETGGSNLWKKVLLGETEKENPDFWKRTLLGNNPSALAHMIEYCAHDVLLTEQVWGKLKPYVKAKSHFGHATNSCPECGSMHIIRRGRRVTVAGTIHIRFQCKECGKYGTTTEGKLDKPKQFL